MLQNDNSWVLARRGFALGSLTVAEAYSQRTHRQPETSWSCHAPKKFLGRIRCDGSSEPHFGELCEATPPSCSCREGAREFVCRDRSVPMFLVVGGSVALFPLRMSHCPSRRSFAATVHVVKMKTACPDDIALGEWNGASSGGLCDHT